MDDDTLDDTLDNGSFASTTTTVTTSCTDSNLNNPLQSWLDRTDHASLGLWSASSVARVESPRDPHRTEPAPASSVADSDNESTFWQSGPGIQVPHWLVVRFPRVIHLSLVVVSLNMALDGAMTPSDVEVLAGYSPMSLVSVATTRARPC
ncbi:hypothetical protein BC828DRAFT_405419 [Blastocladiella britannica]|nr:hypothetical protein BC828DRAFT_405419 [Blastocladiella britannica]